MPDDFDQTIFDERNIKAADIYLIFSWFFDWILTYRCKSIDIGVNQFRYMLVQH